MKTSSYGTSNIKTFCRQNVRDVTKTSANGTISIKMLSP
jgi:hypothetical protein